MKKKKTEEKKRTKKKTENKKKKAQLENINPHKDTSEASICKMGFPQKIPSVFLIRQHVHV